MKKLLALLLLPAFAFGAEFTADGPCQVHFSPKGGITESVVQLIDSSKVSVHLLAYNFTSRPIADALLRAHKRGVDVQLVLDRSVPTEKGSMLPYVKGIPAWIDRTHHIAHNKVIIEDGNTVETGSFNYTDSAENNNGENALICPTVSGAAVYEADFQKHKAHSQRY